MRNTWPRPDLPPPYSNWTFTWRNGRQLATAKTGTKTTKYEYNADGLRTRKVNADGTYADYYWVGSTLLAEVQYKANGAFTRTLMFLHDEKGAIVGIGVKNAGETRFTHYYYAKNLQGDVAAIYRSDYTEAKGYYPTLVASYEYDAWGKVTSVKGSSGAILSLEAYPNHIAHVNPIRYRGYYYDNETGFYYLQSRYYDPAISRFINADSYGSTGQAFLGTNMFAYCGNNPVNHADPEGKLFDWIGGAVGAVIGGVTGALTTAATGGSWQDVLWAGFKGTLLGGISGLTGAKTVVNVISAFDTALGCWESGASFWTGLGCGLLDFGVSTFMGKMPKFGYAVGTAIDLTFGLGASMCVTAITTGIENNAQFAREERRKSHPQPNLADWGERPFISPDPEKPACGGGGRRVRCYW